MPYFLYKGRLFAGMAAFKGHATFGFWRGKDFVDVAADRPSVMGQFGRLTSIDDLPPPAELSELIRKAMAASEAAPSHAGFPAKPKLEMPDVFRSALDNAPDARANFEAFSPGARREYLEWIIGAKRPETRAERIAEAVGWIVEGKKRNWKYQR